MYAKIVSRYDNENAKRLLDSPRYFLIYLSPCLYHGVQDKLPETEYGEENKAKYRRSLFFSTLRWRTHAEGKIEDGRELLHNLFAGFFHHVCLLNEALVVE